MTDRTELERQIAELQAQLAALPDVDPLLVEAREIAGSKADEIINKSRPYYWSSRCREGRYDHTLHVQIALAALRRGMELAPRAAMDAAAVEALAEQVAAENVGRPTFYIRDTNSYRSALAAIRATLSRVPAAAWPGSGEVSNWAWEIAAKWKAESEGADLTFYHSACLEMARRLKAHMTGGAQ
jgi:hypothetical protein